MVAPAPARKARTELSADSLFQLIRSRFEALPDTRAGGQEISPGDALMSAFAMFSLKDPSLLAFDERRRDPNDNFRTIYGIDNVPCDTQFDAATGVLHHFRWHHGVPLNESHPDHLVNVLEYWEIHPTKIVKKVARAGKVQHFSWITDFVPTPDNVYTLMRGGRARWKIENETFNTLKNQGYNLEHNYGHGTQNLSVVLMMLLVFLVDQT